MEGHMWCHGGQLPGSHAGLLWFLTTRRAPDLAKPLPEKPAFGLRGDQGRDSMHKGHHVVSIHLFTDSLSNRSRLDSCDGEVSGTIACVFLWRLSTKWISMAATRPTKAVGYSVGQ